jgi:hypothetical protein
MTKLEALSADYRDAAQAAAELRGYLSKLREEENGVIATLHKLEDAAYKAQQRLLDYVGKSSAV